MAARRSIRREQRDFVASASRGGTNPVERHAYARLGANESFTALPAVMHFGGYSLNVVHEQKLSIVNKSTSSKRMHVIPPTTPYFRARFENKGWVAPGMSTDLIIEFAPTEWRYYYDCVRVHADKENLLVPIHGYPVMNDVIFPKIIDFGVTALAETATRVVELTCKVPIQFEYELTVTAPHPDFKIGPLKGIVPPNGSTPITIEFHPLKLVSAHMEIEVNVSQFGFKPFRCQISGTAAAGLTREQALAQAEAKVAVEDDPRITTTLTDYSPEVNTTVRGVGSGGVFDPGLEAIEAKIKEKRARTKAKTERYAKMGRKPPLPPAKGSQDAVAPLEKVVEGVRVPETLDKPSSINFMLTQSKGKLKPKDLAAAIEAQNAQRAKQAAAQARLKAMQGEAARDAPGPGLTLSAMEAEERGGGADDIDEADDAPGSTMGFGAAAGGTARDVDEDGPPDEDARRLREMVFLQDVSEIDKAERAREFQSARKWVGEDDLTREQVAKVRATRLAVRNAAAIRARQTQRQTPDTVAKGPHAVVPTRVTVLAHQLPMEQPTFDLYKNDVWTMRKQVILRLREVVTRDIVRRRASERLAALRKRIAGVAAEGPAAVRALVEKDHRQAQTAGASEPAAGGAAEVESPWIKGFRLKPSVVQRVSFPEVPEADEGGGLGEDAKVSTSTARSFQELTLFRSVEPPEHSVMAYSDFPLPPVPTFVPQEKDRALREGATEESSVRLFDPAHDRRLEEASATTDLSVPARCRTVPEPAASLAPLLPDPGFRPVQPLEAITEASPDYILQPALAVPFSLAAPRVPTPPPPEEPADDDDMPAAAAAAAAADAEASKADGDEPMVHPAEDLNKLVPTRSQADGAGLGSYSLRALAPLQTLSEVWRPRRERPDPDLDAPAVWQPPRLPQLLTGGLSEDDLSDDSESDDEDAKEAIPLTMDSAAAMFADEEADAEDEAKEGAEKGEGEGDDSGAADPAADIKAIPRDRALLALAAKARIDAVQAAEWLDHRMRLLDATIVNPKHRFRFEAW